jgi:hypothetical protein
MALVDQLEYPWPDPVAQELHRVLFDLFPVEPVIRPVAVATGLRTDRIAWHGAATVLWAAVLNAAAQAGKLGALVQLALDQAPPDSPVRPFLTDLLAGLTPPVSAEPRAEDGAPAFVHADDSVSVPESLLFGDDLTMPIGQVAVLVETLRALLRIGPSVCKLTVGFGAGSGEQYGTGFRIGPDLLLTNWHVVHRRSDASPAATLTAEFGFEDDTAGALLSSRPVRCEPAAAQADRDDDWAVVRCLDPLDDGWPAVPLTNLPTPAVQAPAYIVQHPMGQRKRVGFVRNPISYVDERVVQYLTDTDVGSSGAPVLDASGRLIALHHSGGRPHTDPGRQPVRKNEGVRMSRIATALAGRGLAAAGVALDQVPEG